ncbi:MAG: thioredoxin family protein [Deferrisomatales bacterium]
MKVEILGGGCKNCEVLYANVLEAVERAGLCGEVEVAKVTDIDAILQMGVYTTPGLVVDGEVVSAGRVLEPEQILEHLRPRST